MLKRAAMFVALAMFISMVSLTNAHAEARGPKIFGLQVGIPWEEAVQIVKQYASKKGLNIEEDRYNPDGSPDSSIGAGKGRDRNFDPYIQISKFLMSDKKIDCLASMRIYPKAFNIQEMDKEKLEIICNKYGIDLEKMKSNGMGDVQYSNSREGYKVIITDFGSLIIELAEKSSDIIME